MPPDNSRVFVPRGAGTGVLGRVIRVGATAGSDLPPSMWREASAPLLKALQAGGADRRPPLAPEQLHSVRTCSTTIW